MVKATINTTGINRVSINKQQQETVRTLTLNPQSIVINSLRGLNDVDATTLLNNETVVYDSASDKFIVKTLPLIDGGSF
jgi:hypothetical protein